MRSEITDNETLNLIYMLLMLPNRLVLKISYATGLRISDVLLLKRKNFSQKMTIIEQKTKKTKKIYIPKKLYMEVVKYINTTYSEKYIFPNRKDPAKHRTRQAVWYDIKRACKCLRYNKQISPHTMRKMYAVSLFEKGYSLLEIRDKLNHDNEAVTIIYIMSELLKNKKRKKK